MTDLPYELLVGCKPPPRCILQVILDTTPAALHHLSTVQENGKSYIEASCNGDLAVARCLRRLGVPWGPPGRVFLAIARGLSTWTASWPMLRWLLQEGCPVEYKVVEAGLACRHSSPEVVDKVLGLLREYLGPRQPA